jgi:hypothetical protein
MYVLRCHVIKTVGMQCTSYVMKGLRALVPSSSLVRFKSIQVHHHHPKVLFSNGGGKTIPSGWCSHISGSYSMRDLFFHFGGGWSLHNVQFMFYCNLLDPPAACFTNSGVLGSCWIPSCCIVAVSGLSSLSHFCVPVLADTFSRTSVLSKFLVQHCHCLVPDARVPCAMSSSWQQRLISSGIHNLPGSVPPALGGALRLDTSPYAAYSSLCQFPL